MNIVLVNDDGYNASGINIMATKLLEYGHFVTMVAPSRDSSGCSHSMSFYKSLELTELERRPNFIKYSLEGTPVDCARLGIDILSPRPVDLLISGINDMLNCGTDIIYSGTFNAAYEGTLCGTKSIAISTNMPNLEYSAEFLCKNLSTIHDHFFDKACTININVPNKKSAIRGISITSIGEKKYTDNYECVHTDDPKIKRYILTGDPIHVATNASDSDVVKLDDDYISISPVCLYTTVDSYHDYIRQFHLEL